MAHHRAGNLSSADAIYRTILGIDPAQPDALHLLGLLAHRASRFEEALALFDQAIQINPNYEVYFSSRGNTLRVLGRHELALESFNHAIQLNPTYAAAHYNLGLLLQQTRQFEAALTSYDQAIALEPKLADAHNNRGNTLKALQRNYEALQSFATAEQLNPNQAETHINSGNVYLETHRYNAALNCYNNALEIDPSSAKAHSNRGIALQSLKQYRQALHSFEEALRLDPAIPYLEGMKLHMKRHLCLWDNSAADLQRIEEQVFQGKRVVTPYCLLTLSDSPSLQRKAAEIHIADTCPHPRASPPLRYPRHNKIRIGYFSSDFRNHPVAWLMAEVFERHNRDHFEIFGFSTGPDTQDEMRLRTSATMDHFFEVQSASDTAIVELSRSNQIDIAIDLNGLSYGDRTGIFAQRAAPIQVNYLGYPGTMGAPFIDYLIADETVIPESDRDHFIEKIVSLPDCFQANDSTREIPTPAQSRNQSRIQTCAKARTRHALPETGFVYCCFNNPVKITPDVFAQWMQIMDKVPNSVLWLTQGDPFATLNLRDQAQRQGIDPQRLIFAPPVPYAEHISRQTLADLFLDTLPFNAGATASPALWAGLPVLTQIGETFAGRMAASLLQAIQMPELIAHSSNEYRDLAISTGNNPTLCQHLKQKLADNRLTAPLFETAAFTTHLESAYTQMHERHHARLPPDHLRIARIPPNS